METGNFLLISKLLKLFVWLYLYVPDEGSLQPKYRNCTTYNDFEMYIYISSYTNYIYHYVTNCVLTVNQTHVDTTSVIEYVIVCIICKRIVGLYIIIIIIIIIDIKCTIQFGSSITFLPVTANRSEDLFIDLSI